MNFSYHPLKFTFLEKIVQLYLPGTLRNTYSTYFYIRNILNRLPTKIIVPL